MTKNCYQKNKKYIIWSSFMIVFDLDYGLSSTLYAIFILENILYYTIWKHTFKRLLPVKSVNTYVFWASAIKTLVFKLC